ncbi:MAG: histidine kinase dimerization/phospho-acceptor domain-containing protein [Sphingomonadaceae bacterium]|nr:HAMP domain-containing histidine kinase [Sphingomonadaceae bacterium]
MFFDDRLATVLRQSATGERASRTQFRQLLDLLGSGQSGRDASLREAAMLRLEALEQTIPAAERASMIGEQGLRLRDPALVAHLAEGEPSIAIAVLGRAELSAEQWDAIVPALPVRARGFLRLRRGLPDSTVAILERLGVHDRGLPLPESMAPQTNEPDQLAPADAPAPAPAQPSAPLPANDLVDSVAETASDPEESEIGALVRRIEAFQKGRAAPHREDAPHLPLGEQFEARPQKAEQEIPFTTDAEGRINWAEGPLLSRVFGLGLPEAGGKQLVMAMQRYAMLRAMPVELQGAAELEGRWQVDASPRFTRPGGAFIGYAGALRRMPEPLPLPPQESEEAREGARMRELLHELRTPVNAIQGFAEVIQQQLFGPTPHEYRAHAAEIASDAARMLAGFDELDRLARLETGALEPEPGEADFAAIARRMLAQLQTVLAPRTASFEIGVGPLEARIPLAQKDAEALAWRIFATLAGAMGAGEQCKISLTVQGKKLMLECELPLSLADKEEVFVSSRRASTGALSAGMFGAGFSLRLARAEARALGGELEREEDWLHMELPVLTGKASPNSDSVNAKAAGRP